MSGQKGSFLDKLKAFFIRRKEAKRKKKELERKELEEILKNISEKIQPIGTIIHAYNALDNIDLKKVTLTTPKNKVHIIDKKGEVKEQENVNNKEEMIDEIFDLDEMNISSLKELKSNLVSKKQETIPIEEKIINEFENKDHNKEIKDDININENKVKDKDSKVLFVSKDKVKIDENKAKKDKVVFKDAGLFNFIFTPKTKNKKTYEEDMSLILIRMIDKNLYELDYLKDELNYLTESNKKAKTKEEIFEIEQRFQILKERIESAFKEFISLKNSNIVADIPDIKYNEEFVELVEKYKLEIYDNDVIKQTLLDIENRYKTSLNVLESIVALEGSKEIINDEISKDKTDILVGNEEITLTDDTINKIEFMKEELNRNLDENKRIVEDAIRKVESIKPEEKVSYHLNIMQNLVKSAVYFSFSYAMLNPRRGRLSNMLGAAAMLNGVRLLGHAFTPEKEIKYVSSNDFELEIKEHLNDFEYIKQNVDLSINEIENIKSEFIEKYGSSRESEINDTLKSINNLEEQLKDIKVEMIIQEARLNQTLSKNNQIVKKIEYDNKKGEAA